MSIGIYADHHVKAAIVEGLRRRGVSVLTCAEDETDMREDEHILERATELGRVVFTQDDDLVALQCIEYAHMIAQTSKRE